MEPWFDVCEAEALGAYVRGGGWGTEFRQTEKFESQLGELTKAKHVVVTTSGTVALSVAYLAAGVGVGDEVIVPNLTMIATPNAARMIGAVPVLVDIEAATLNIDITQVEASITARTKAVVHVSLNGRSNNIEALLALCRKKGIKLIEDSCQSLGSTNGGRHLGTIGDIGTLSFSPPKIITTGQGGAIITNSDEAAKAIRKLKDFGRTSGGHDFHDSIGFNFKFTDFQATVGIEQMKKLPWRLERKKEIWHRYRSNLTDVQAIQWIKTDTDAVAPWFIDIYLENRDGLAAWLRDRDIGSRPVYPPIHSQEAYNLRALSFPVTEFYSTRGLWLPSAVQLSNTEIDRVSEAIISFFSA
jgi:perosamine synthetase